MYIKLNDRAFIFKYRIRIIFSFFFARHDFGPINISFEKYFSKQYLNIHFTILLQ